MGLTTDPNDPELGRGIDDKQVDQNKKYLVLSAEELAKGFTRPYREVYIHDTCGTETRMNENISATYARDPKFYGATYCCHCRKHLPVSEFTWKGTEIKVGE